MTATATTALVPVQPAFSDAERLALAGFLAGYRGLTREAYALDLRQFTISCRACRLNLFAVRRADIEHLGLDRGHRTLAITRKGGKVVTIRWRRAPPGRSIWPSASAPKGRCSCGEREGHGEAESVQRDRDDARAEHDMACRAGLCPALRTEFMLVPSTGRRPATAGQDWLKDAGSVPAPCWTVTVTVI